MFIFISSLVFADTKPEPLTRQNAEQLATAMGVVYVDMSKEALYQVFTKEGQKGYYKEGNEEWITFSDWTTEKPGDKITFYLRDGKVKGWKQKKDDKPPQKPPAAI